MSELLKYCETDQQAAVVRVYEKTGSYARAAEQLGMQPDSVRRSYIRTQQRAAKQSHAPGYPHDGKGLPGFATKRISTHYSKDGTVSGWHIQEPERVHIQQAIEDFVAGLAVPVAKPVPAPKKSPDTADLMPSIFIGDAHVGQYSYGAETRQGDFDTDIATAQIREAVKYLVDMAPAAETGLLVDVGDALHADSAHNQTFKGTPVDVDTRYHKTLKALAMVMRYAVDRMLRKFQKVVVIVARGNHNDSSAIAVQLMLEMYYEKEPRVQVLKTQGYFHYLQFGANLIAVHHGDKVKAHEMPMMLARDLPQAWGETNFRLCATGHIHHQTTREVGGCMVRSFGTLAAPDGWHASQGYGSQRVMEMLTFHRAGGIHSTNIYTIRKESVLSDIKV